MTRTFASRASIPDRDDGDGLLNPAADVLVAADATSADGWTFNTSTAGLASGNYTYFAEGTDADGGVLDIASVVVHVTQVEVVSYASTNVPKQIKDLTTITSTITVPDSFTVLDLDLQLNIMHTFDGDLTAYLIAPDGFAHTAIRQRRRQR